MKTAIIVLSTLNVMFLLLHELDACLRGEWRMFRFLRRFSEKTQSLVFLYAHGPLVLFLFFYLWSVVTFNNFILWLAWNGLIAAHGVLHLIARKWKSNVFASVHSFGFIMGAALTGLANLCLFSFYLG